MYGLVKETKAATNKVSTSAAGGLSIRNKKVSIKNFATFTNRICEINNTQVDNAKDDVVMAMYNLLYYSSKYLKTLGSSLHHYKDE